MGPFFLFIERSYIIKFKLPSMISLNRSLSHLFLLTTIPGKSRFAGCKNSPGRVAVVSVIGIVLVKLIKPPCLLLVLLRSYHYNAIRTIGTLTNGVINTTARVLTELMKS